MNIVRWLAFAWGCLAATVMGYYAIQWTIQSGNPLRNELGIGFGLGLVYGFPAWIALPIFAYLGREEQRGGQFMVLLAPLAFAATATVFLGVMGGL
jgi:Mg/Co/Ni transporter MgtE